MSEAYPQLEVDPFHIHEAKHFYERMKLLHMPKSCYGPPRNRHDSSLYKSEMGTVIMGYFSAPRITEEYKSLFPDIDESFGLEYPSVTFRLVGNGLYHSTIGYVPPFFRGQDNVQYGALNRFVINKLGQSYREDTLSLDLGNELTGRIPKHQYPQLETSPQISDLGTHINPFEQGDYELIGYYLDQIDQGQLVKS